MTTRKASKQRTESQRHVEQQKQSGLTVAQYCKQYNINRSTFANWSARFSKAAQTLEQTQSNAQTSSDWLELKESIPPINKETTLIHGTKISLTLPGGIMLSIESPSC